MNQTGASQGFNPLSFGTQQAARGGGLLKSLTNPGTINSFLTNTQKVLNTAQQVGPLVNQYGPIVKNLPMMWKLYRGLKDAPEFNENQEQSSIPRQKNRWKILLPFNAYRFRETIQKIKIIHHNQYLSYTFKRMFNSILFYF